MHLLIIESLSVQADEAQLGPFTVAPAEFALDRKESLQIQVAYLPEVAGRHEQDFVLACDNGTSAVYKLSGIGKPVKTSHTFFKSWPSLITPNKPAQSQINCMLACNNGTSTVYKLSGIGKAAEFATLWVTNFLHCFELTEFDGLGQALMLQTHTSD